MTDLTATVAELRALLEKAKPLPWAWNSYSRIDSVPVAQQYNEAEALIPDDATDDDPRWAALPEAAACYVDSIKRGDLATKQGEADAKFIVAAVNALPDLLARLESADSLDRAWTEAEAALPEGWVMETGDNATGGYWAQAYGPETEDGHPSKDGFGPTPILALQALATALRTPR